ncbi:hypothetical protein DUI87_17478 [Hirundo rustica rustica]|uniref:Uncharacterized protein n=1 Tax=Hirundo rustica rustica TaxID=333673 RepID=A0A3M0JYB7_HIRRU|nr:hypothetical protein DUI87_17478 [Hirundo rustica rustica]
MERMPAPAAIGISLTNEAVIKHLLGEALGSRGNWTSSIPGNVPVTVSFGLDDLVGSGIWAVMEPPEAYEQQKSLKENVNQQAE